MTRVDVNFLFANAYLLSERYLASSCSLRIQVSRRLTQETRSVRFPGCSPAVDKRRESHFHTSSASRTYHAANALPGAFDWEGPWLFPWFSVSSVSFLVGPTLPDYLGFFEDLSTWIRKKRPNRKTNVVVIM